MAGPAPRVISFKMKPGLLEAFDRACTENGFSNRSECIRAMIVAFIAAHERISRGEAPEEVMRELVSIMFPDAHSTRTYHTLAAVVASMIALEVLSEVAARVDELMMIKEYVEERGASPRPFITPLLDPEYPILDDDGGDGGEAAEA